MLKAWFALAVIALVLVALLGRYEIVPATYEDAGIVLKFDRWTGQTKIWMMADGAGWSQGIGDYRPSVQSGE